MIYLEVLRAKMVVLLELLNEEEDKNSELEAQNLMLVALEDKTLEEDKL